jgi:hypothetical protein
LQAAPATTSTSTSATNSMLRGTHQDDVLYHAGTADATTATRTTSAAGDRFYQIASQLI